MNFCKYNFMQKFFEFKSFLRYSGFDIMRVKLPSSDQSVEACHFLVDIPA